MKPTNYERYVQRKMKDPAFRAAHRRASEAVGLALQIRQVREERGWTQAELARRIGTSQSAIARMESGNYNGYTVGILRRIAEATRSELEIRLVIPPRGGRPHRKTG